jgi:hypothetical protein
MPAPRTNTLEIRYLSILAASIVLINAFSRLVIIPSRGVLLTIFSIQWAIEMNGRLLFMMLLAALVITGSEAIFRSHPLLRMYREQGKHYTTVPHWILPALAAFGGSGALNLFPSGPRWWLGLILVSGLLVMCIAAEYYTLDRADYRHDPSALALNMLGLTILALILSAIHFSAARVAMALPTIGCTAAIIGLRLLDLQAPRSRKAYLFACGIGLIVSELALPLEFLPMSSVAFGLILTLVTYDLSGIAQASLSGALRRGTVFEYLAINAIALAVLMVLLV